MVFVGRGRRLYRYTLQEFCGESFAGEVCRAVGVGVGALPIVRDLEDRVARDSGCYRCRAARVAEKEISDFSASQGGCYDLDVYKQEPHGPTKPPGQDSHSGLGCVV